MSSLRKVILSGFFWSVINQLSVTITTLLITGVLARLISPSDFGIIAMVTLAIGFLNVIKDFGFGAALIQKKEVADDEYSTVFWINIAIGVVLTAIVFFISPYIGRFFKEPRVELMTKILSFTFIINSVGIVWNNKLIKSVSFNQLFYGSFVSTIISGIVAITIAYRGYGIWALVVQTYVQLVLNTCINYFHVKWLPTFTVKKHHVKSLVKFGLPLLADQSINFWVRNVDNLLVGRILGEAPLAYYSKAYSLMLLPVRQLTGTLTKVLFPSFSMIQDDKARIASIYLKISRIIAFVAFPIMIAVSLMAEPLILIIYGPQWRPAIPIFKILSILGMFQAIAALSGDIYLSLGETKLMFYVGLFSKIAMICGIVAGIYMGGIMGMVYGYCVASALGFFPEMYFLARLINLKLKDAILNIMPYLLISCICCLVIYFAFNNIHFNLVIGFIVKIISFGLLYVVLNIAVKSKVYADILLMIKSKNQ